MQKSLLILNHVSPCVHTYKELTCYTLVNIKSCTKSDCGTSLDTMLANKPRNFCNTCAVPTSLSDYHKLILPCLRADLKRLSPKKDDLLSLLKVLWKCFYDLDQEMIKGWFYQHGESFSVLISLEKISW